MKSKIIMIAEDKSLLREYITIFMFVSAYWIVSILTVFVNKTLFSGLTLDAPMFITLYQTLVTVLICVIKKYLAKFFPSRFHFPKTDIFNMNILKKLLPVAIMFTAMIATNNLCLKYVSVAFYYVGRSLTTIFNVIFTFIILKETTSLRSIFFCGLIVSGFFMGVDQEHLIGTLSIIGTIFGILGSLTLSLYSIMTKKVLPKVDNEVWALSYYNNIYASILFIPIMYLNGEFEQLYQYENLWTLKFWLYLTIGGVFGFAVGFFTSLQIKYTSALTHNISGTAKACAQTVLATYWYDEDKPILWWCSNFVVLFGSAGYARVKQLDMEKKHRLNSFVLKK